MEDIDQFCIPKTHGSLYSRDRIAPRTTRNSIRPILLLILHSLILHVRRLIRLIPLQDIPSTLRKSQVIRSDKILSLWGMPVARFPGLDLQQEHGVNLLKGSAGGLRQQEVHHQHGDEIACREEVSVREADVLDDELGGESDEEVESPVRCRTKGDAGTSVPGRIDFGSDGPRHWSPSAGESCDEEAGKDDHDISNRGAVAAVWSFELKVAHRCEDHEAHEHPGCAESETLSAAVLLDHVETWEGSDYVDCTQNDLCDEWIG